MIVSEVGPKAYLETRVDIPKDLVDVVCDFVIENLSNGIVLEDEEGSSHTTLVFYVDEKDKHSRDRLTEFLRGLVGSSLSELPVVDQRRIKDISWIDEYRKSIKPIWICEDLAIRPSWNPSLDAKYEIIIEPRMAFGTGSHATTHGCLAAIRQSFKKGMRFLDVGTGSGILSILTDKMGATYIRAVDYDPEAVTNCRENFKLNGVTAQHDVLQGSIDVCSSENPYDFVCANIIRTTILSMLDQLLFLTAPDGLLVLSGLLDQDEKAVTDALAARGQTNPHIDRIDQWLTYTVHKR